MRQEPEERPSAAELLRHPFVAKCARNAEQRDSEREDRRQNGEGEAAEGEAVREDAVPKLVLDELEEIVSAVKQYYEKRWAQGQQKVEDPPPADRARLRRLAEQLGAPAPLVRRAFFKMIKQLRLDLAQGADDQPTTRSSESQQPRQRASPAAAAARLSRRLSMS